MAVVKNFWFGKKVFITGHTGFKGAWLSFWLHQMGADVTGYALKPPTDPSLFSTLRLADLIHSIDGDIREFKAFSAAVKNSQAEIVFHLAAQSLVLESYREPVSTYETNVMGAVNLLEAVREAQCVRAVVVVTTDKCYENREWLWGYRENEALGGHDPYSSSKACAELVAHAYRSSFFPSAEYKKHRVGIATARAGNVIGGGDFSPNRLIPDCMRALEKGSRLEIRNPKSVRPWQHVLEALAGYLKLAEKLYSDGAVFSEAWNFGPDTGDMLSVESIVNKLNVIAGNKLDFVFSGPESFHEAGLLKLDSSKARARLGWKPCWTAEIALEHILAWSLCHFSGGDLRDITLKQIKKYVSAAA